MGGRYFVMDSTGGRWQYNDGEDATSSLLTDNTNYFSGGLGQTVGGMSGSDVSYMTDALGSTLGLTDPGQATKESDVYDAFGNITARSSALTFSLGESVLYGGAQGYQTDNDTGLVRCGNRYYNPYFGRFITRDPAESGMNWYAYCGNDPVDKSDKTGLDTTFNPLAGGTPSQGSLGSYYQGMLDDLNNFGNTDSIIGLNYANHKGSQTALSSSVSNLNSTLSNFGIPPIQQPNFADQPAPDLTQAPNSSVQAPSVSQGLGFLGGLTGTFGALAALVPTSTTTTTTTAYETSLFWGLLKTSGSSTTVTESVGALGIGARAGWIGVYAVAVATASYNAYNWSNSQSWFGDPSTWDNH